MNNKLEKLKILDLLDKKEITLEEAQQRLEALKVEAQEVIKTKSSSSKAIKIQVNSSDGDIVNIQVPVNFARLILKGKNTMKFSSKLNDFDIDFEEIFTMIDEGILGELVNIESADGDTVRIAVE